MEMNIHDIFPNVKSTQQKLTLLLSCGWVIFFGLHSVADFSLDWFLQHEPLADWRSFLALGGYIVSVGTMLWILVMGVKFLRKNKDIFKTK